MVTNIYAFSLQLEICNCCFVQSNDYECRMSTVNEQQCSSLYFILGWPCIIYKFVLFLFPTWYTYVFLFYIYNFSLHVSDRLVHHQENQMFNTLKPELNPICYLLALLGAHHFLHVKRIRVKLLTFRRLMSYIYGASILDVSRSHTTTQHSR